MAQVSGEFELAAVAAHPVVEACVMVSVLPPVATNIGWSWVVAEA
jgi:hypothetical protein